MSLFKAMVGKDLVLRVENGRCSYTGSNWAPSVVQGQLVLKARGDADGMLKLLCLGLVGSSPGAAARNAHRIALSAYEGDGELRAAAESTFALELALAARMFNTQAGCNGPGLRPGSGTAKLTGTLRKLNTAGTSAFELIAGSLEFSSAEEEGAAAFVMAVDLAGSRLTAVTGSPNRRTLKLQPVQHATHGANPTGGQWQMQLRVAQTLWNQCCIFVDPQPMITIEGSPARTSTDRCTQLAALTAQHGAATPPFPLDAIPVFYIDDPLAGDGGGRTDMPGSGLDAIFISSHTMNGTVLAHELGHVLGGDHPDPTDRVLTPSASTWIGEYNTILVPGNGLPSPEHNSGHNCQYAHHALLAIGGPCAFTNDLP